MIIFLGFLSEANFPSSSKIVVSLVLLIRLIGAGFRGFCMGRSGRVLAVLISELMAIPMLSSCMLAGDKLLLSAERDSITGWAKSATSLGFGIASVIFGLSDDA